MTNKIYIILIMTLCAGILATCGGRETNPVEGTTDTGEYNPTANPAGYFDLITAPSGGPFDRAAGMAVVDHEDPRARISCEFATVLDTAYIDSAFSLVTSAGVDAEIQFEVEIGNNTRINITPVNDLSYNTTYILTLSSALLMNAAGDMLDVDGDKIGGETPDDDIVLRFTTHYQGDAFDDRDNDDTYDNLVDSNGDHVWETSGVGEAFTDERPYNNVWNPGETYTDANGNGSYDAGERFTDNNGDGDYNSNAEALVDTVNINGYADLGEFFVDNNNDSAWTDAETYTDVNSNSEWDDTELRFDRDGDGLYDPADGDTYSDVETVNGICDYAEPFINTDGDSVQGPAWDSTMTNYWVPHWDDAEPVNVVYDFDNDGEYDAGVYLLPAGGYAFEPTSVALRTVYRGTTPENLRFMGFTETFTDANNDLIWNPEDTFEDHISNGVWDMYPETLTVDLNGNGAYDTALAGTPVPPTADDLPPVVDGTGYFLIGQNIVGTVWLDVTIAVDIHDSTYDASGNKVMQGLPSDVFDTSTVILRDVDTKTSVPGTIAYVAQKTSAFYTRLTFDPESNLAAGKDYELVLKAQQIADTAGNKLNDTADLEFQFTTGDRTSDGSVVVDDITPPTSTFDGHAAYFDVYFSEEIDVTTINSASISVTTAGGDPISGSLVITRFDELTAPTGFATMVSFYPLDPNSTSGTVTVKGTIKDLAGNLKGADSQYNW
jgi:hypothetical protein